MSNQEEQNAAERNRFQKNLDATRKEQTRLELLAIEERNKARLKIMEQNNLNKGLVSAILNNNLERVKKLLADGADPNFYDGSGREPPKYGVTQALMVDLAVRPGIQIGILDALLDAGADVQYSVHDPYAERSRPFILTQAAKDRRYDILELVLNKRPDYDFELLDPYDRLSFRQILNGQGRFPFEILLWGITSGLTDHDTIDVRIVPEEDYEYAIPFFVRSLSHLYKHLDFRSKIKPLHTFFERMFNADIATKILTEALTDKAIKGKHALNRRKHLVAAMSHIKGGGRGTKRRRDTKRRRGIRKN